MQDSDTDGKSMKRILFLLIIFFLPKIIFGQFFFRIEGEISVKEKGQFKSQLSIGKFYYDLNYRKIVYDLSFPEKQTLVIKDTLIFNFVNDIPRTRSGKYRYLIQKLPIELGD